MKITKMTNPEGKVFDIVPDGVAALEALGWERGEASDDEPVLDEADSPVKAPTKRATTTITK